MRLHSIYLLRKRGIYLIWNWSVSENISSLSVAKVYRAGEVEISTEKKAAFVDANTPSK